MTDRTTIAHISDIHLSPLPPFWPWHWNIKRALGYANWHKSRRFTHLRRVTDQMIADLQTQGADHIAVTGDLTNIGLPREHQQAVEWLATLGAPENVSVIPGNHDIYCPLWSDEGTRRWAPYATNTLPDRAGLALEDGVFPFVRPVGNCVLVGVNTAVPTRPGLAIGEIGQAQLARLGRILDVLSARPVCRVVLVHHPPLPGQARPSRALRDAQQLAQVLARHGAELVLHGHNHRPMLDYGQGPQAPFAVVGAPSLSMARRRHEETLAAYNLYHIDRQDCGAKIEMVRRGLVETGGHVVEIERRFLTESWATMDKQS